jgi:hypothetical protein
MQRTLTTIALCLAAWSCSAPIFSWEHEVPEKVGRFEIWESPVVTGPFQVMVSVTNAIVPGTNRMYFTNAHIPSGTHFYYIRAYGTNGFPSDPSTNYFLEVVGPGRKTNITP